jgi:prophage DNA circulation protein
MPLVQYGWRKKWKTASFRDAKFHVDVSTRGGGRRIAHHEYPKKNEGYAEDMGRRAQRRTIEGYIVGPRSINVEGPVGPTSGAFAASSDYTKDRDRLIQALEDDGPGTLKHPLLGDLEVMVDQYSVIENRERGGYCTFAMVFIDAGKAEGGGATSTSAGVSSSAGGVESSASSALTSGLSI